MSDPLAAWTPALAFFLRRSAIVGALTIALMLLVGWIIGTYTEFWQVMYVGPVLALAYNIGFEDPSRWRAARQDRWHLRTDAVIHHGHDGEVRIPLADVVDVRTRLGWSVVIFLKDGQRVRISYVSEPKEIAAQILAARNLMTP